MLTNLGAPPRAGHATFYSRYKTRPNGSVTEGAFIPREPPSVLMRYLTPHGKGLKWNASYAHPKITIDEGKLPALFQAGG